MTSKVTELFYLQNQYSLAVEKEEDKKLEVIMKSKPLPPSNTKEQKKLLEDTASNMISSFEQQSNLMIQELKRSIVISNEMFQVKTKYIQDEIVDLDMKLGEQISTAQIDNARCHEKHSTQLEQVLVNVKMETGRMYAIQREIKEEVKRLEQSVNQKTTCSHPPEEASTRAPSHSPPRDDAEEPIGTKPEVSLQYYSRPQPTAFSRESQLTKAKDQEQAGASHSSTRHSKASPNVPEGPSQKPQNENNSFAPSDNHQEMSQLWKAIPRTADWDTFSGKGKYNHNLFIKQVDMYAQDYMMRNYMI
ncbi:hypothetical protein PCANC_19797, partial [Puccinia coronata f. sp. avenae]